MNAIIGKLNAAALAAFMVVGSGASFAHETDPVKGNLPKEKEMVLERGAPDVVRKEMEVSGYQRVKVSGKFTVYLKQGDEQKIVVETDEELIPEVKHFVAENTLNIYTSDQVRKRITLWITLEDVNNFNKFGSVRVVRE